jgi:PAB-dependent poly(A)-specific ribonuclease subunit 2
MIQSGVHDSTEDAVTALRLYYKYKELCEQGAKHLNEEMDRLYEEGRSRGWVIPVGEYTE